MTEHVKRLIKSAEKHLPGQRLWQKFLETSYQSTLVTTIAGDGVVRSQALTSSISARMNDFAEDVSVSLSVVVQGVTALALHFKRAINVVHKTVSRGRRQFREN